MTHRRRVTLGANLGFVYGIDRIEMFGRREAAGADIVAVHAEGVLDFDVEIGVAPNESRSDLADEVAEDVMRDHELAVDVWAGTDAVHEDVEPLAHVRRRFGGHRLEENGERAGILEREAVIGEPLHRGQGLSLDTIAAELRL